MKVPAGLVAFLVAGVLAGCSQSGPTVAEPAAASMGAQAPDATESADLAAMAANPRLIVVHKTASCGCCHLWVDHVKQNGFEVIVRDVEDLGGIKARVGVPAGMGSCHTARVGGYFIEGHVPAADIQRLLAERPQAKGLTVPGMPLGSPGMEVSSGQMQPYDVHLVAHDGATSVFAHHGEAPPPGS